MTNQIPVANQIQATFQQGGLSQVFIELLGWGAPSKDSPKLYIEADGDQYILQPQMIAQLEDFVIHRIPVNKEMSRPAMRAVDTELGKWHTGRIQIFESPDQWQWHWPKATPSGSPSYQIEITRPNELPRYLAQRLAGLRFTVEDHKKGFGPLTVRERAYGAFDSTEVTKKFYTQFHKEHETLANAIEGLPQELRVDYATTLLNRLMFIYFLQKKEFLNGDPNYLEHLLQGIQKFHGTDKFYSFYKDVLLPLFFDKLNSRDGVVEDPYLNQLIGDIPFINGGIFSPTRIETEHALTLEVPDKAFQQIFDFFSQYTWHLDTRLTGNPDEINPEVLGYIFEQYINQTSSGKKESGAYYTPHEVTSYMVAQTLVPYILTKAPNQAAFFELLQTDPVRYLQPAMLHGWDHENNAWRPMPLGLAEIWESDPTKWPLLDETPHDPDFLLPQETWVEAFHRRERTTNLLSRMQVGEIQAPNQLITDNLAGLTLLTDGIDTLLTGSQLEQLFQEISSISVFDPTCGSGAFLFAALEVLEDVYLHILDALKLEQPNESTQKLLEEAFEFGRPEYFVRKHTAIRNLYGTDIMAGAIETAKLRIFLALAACVDDPADLKPLPDLDFNLKTGNLVVGFKDASDVARVTKDLFTNQRLMDLEPEIIDYENLYSRFVEATQHDDPALTAIKAELRDRTASLRTQANQIYADATKVPAEKYEEWVKTVKPFHWFAEFPEIINKGGFDVVIGNPPYIKRSQLDGYTVAGYQTADCPDFYAACYERSLQLTNPEGRHAFIVMLNLAFSDRYDSLRKTISERGGAEWWSTYGKRPDALFRGVQVVNTILILGPGEHQHATRHRIFARDERATLFQTIEYGESRRTGAEILPRAGLANGLVNEINQLPSYVDASSGDTLFIRGTGRYWFPLLWTNPPVLDQDGCIKAPQDHVTHPLQLTRKEDRGIAGATLAGKIGYLFWSAYGDDLNVKGNTTEGPRRLAAAALQKGSSTFAPLIKQVQQQGMKEAFVTNNKGFYINVRWNAVRPATDLFDKQLLEEMGLSRHWRPLNIWYRQVMRASKPNSNSRALTTKEAQEYLGWDEL